MASRISPIARAWRRNRSEWLAFVLFTAPNILLFLVWTYWPMLRAFQLSFWNWNLISPNPEWRGVRNYVDLLADGAFWRVVANTVIYAVSVVAAAQVLAFALAMLLNRPWPGRTLLRTVAFLPHVTATAAAAVAWVLVLHPAYGPLAAAYHALGVKGPNLLESTTLALAGLIVVGIWKEIGFSSLFLLAGLQNLPLECYEAADLEGARQWSRFWHVTLPLMSPVVFFLLVSGFIAATKVFDTVAIMTEGGPVYPSSSTYVYHLYVLGFRRFNAGMASAFAVVFFLVMMGATLAQFRLARRWVHYEN